MNGGPSHGGLWACSPVANSIPARRTIFIGLNRLPAWATGRQQADQKASECVSVLFDYSPCAGISKLVGRGTAQRGASVPVYHAQAWPNRLGKSGSPGGFALPVGSGNSCQSLIPGGIVQKVAATRFAVTMPNTWFRKDNQLSV
jgi:hypothetical protein